MSGRRARRERIAQLPSPNATGARRWPRLALAIAVVVVVAAVAATIALTRGSSPTASSAASAGSLATAPLQLSGTDPITGHTVSLANYRGKPIVINMWASWCTGCYAEARALETFARTHPQAQVIGVDIQDSKTGARAFYKRFGWTHPSIFDPSGAIATQFQLQGLPATLFLNRQHHVVARILGDTNLAGFDEGLRRASAT